MYSLATVQLTLKFLLREHGCLGGTGVPCGWGICVAKEVFFDPSDIIVSKTDVKGRITYANRTFCDICGFDLPDLIGQPHSIIRHDDMPRAVFKLLWERLGVGDEVFAYVKNRTKSNDYYWVFAHVTPTMGVDGSVTGYHSSRRVPDHNLVANVIEPLYEKLLAEERSEANRKTGLAKSTKLLESVISSHGRSYNSFIFSLQEAS